MVKETRAHNECVGTSIHLYNFYTQRYTSIFHMHMHANVRCDSQSWQCMWRGLSPELPVQQMFEQHPIHPLFLHVHVYVCAIVHIVSLYLCLCICIAYVHKIIIIFGVHIMKCSVDAECISAGNAMQKRRRRHRAWHKCDVNEIQCLLFAFHHSHAILIFLPFFAIFFFSFLYTGRAKA